MAFKNGKGEIISLDKAITAVIEKDNEYEIWVGTDSQVHDRRVCYATVVVLYKKGKGGRVFVEREWEGFSYTLVQRLTNEVVRSIKVGYELLEFLPTNSELVIHIDSNPSKAHKSGNYTQALVGMVMAEGFKYRIKPEAWAAQSAADHFTK